MSVEIRVPSVGESVQEAVLAEWFKNDGDMVVKDEPLFVIETDKVTLEVVAEASGILSGRCRETASRSLSNSSCSISFTSSSAGLSRVR